ncbi:TIGR03087 family PEP-CTERM/XrtA system glycosyltransferase [Sphingomonas sp. ABOLE]|uniref:TIGR03087 family PEP-CTERM/XrtA system glycosyltransferase n=1 Tax=Sphingomonas sp. ABOLE TaxID=1985878 RepID=UPI000F7E16A5|nr:TIGR03087 family PEP-CTERM/XrtA system glycosyltransferase [Sphingomonas sp. ABOLE]RSV43233.1 TIGR03087 family PEP-CTERM/XrtA system glycosyltransferase [Sphingomonas sp. ABOLE]
MGDLLFLAHRMPFPPDRGDKIRAYHLLRHLARNHRLHLVAFADDPDDLRHQDGLAAYAATRTIVWRDAPTVWTGARALLQRRPVSLVAFADPAARRAMDALLAAEPIETIFLFSSQMAQYLPPAPRQRVIMDFVDMDSAKFAAYAEGGRGPMAWVHRREASLLLAHERRVAGAADASLFVSEAEAALFRARTNASHVYAIENGIDTVFYDPASRFEPTGGAGPLLVFTGQMDYRPNVEAVTWFADKVFPRVRLAHSAARFAIVGRAPTQAVQALAERPGILVTGTVPDVRDWLAAAALVVAPLQLARGIQNKVLEGMAMARAVVASPAAAEGIDHAGTLCVAEGADAFGDAVLRLLDAPDTATALGAAARARVIARYSWDARLAPLDALLEAPARQRHQRGGVRGDRLVPGRYDADHERRR